MFILGLDDGSNYGPFETLDEVLHYDLEQMVLEGLPEYHDRAIAILANWREQDAEDLVVRGDHLIFEIKQVVTSSHSPFIGKSEEVYQNMIGFSIDLIKPNAFLCLIERD